MFKYIWIAILALIYIAWGVATVLDIIHTYKLHTDDSIIDVIDNLETYSHGFICVNLFVLFFGSLIAFVLSKVE